MSPAPHIRRVPPVRFTFAGRAVEGHPGESVGVALMRAGVTVLGKGPGDGGPRGMFCGMGLCQECLVQVAGRRVEACRLAVAEGLVVEPLGPLP
jgi:predicted molibdopterin-dependent oxidoreductase YjgC